MDRICVINMNGFLIARSKYGYYGLSSADIKIDHQGRAVLSKTADRESWDYCLAEVRGGRFANDDNVYT